MEDVALSKTLKRIAGRPACLRARVTTSGRRWEAHGPWRTIFTCGGCALAYALGADPAALVRALSMSADTAAPLLLVFAKAPVPGAVKTRLAAAIGAERAARVYRDLLATTLAHAHSAWRARIVSRDRAVGRTPIARRPFFAGSRPPSARRGIANAKATWARAWRTRSATRWIARPRCF